MSSPWELDLSMYGFDSDIQAELDKIDNLLKSTGEVEVKKDKVSTRNEPILLFQEEMSRATTVEQRALTFIESQERMRKAKKRKTYLRKKEADLTYLQGYQNFCRLATQTWNKHCSIKMLRIIGLPTKADYARMSEIWKESDHNVKRGVAIIFQGIRGMQESYFYKKQEQPIPFSLACANSKMIQWSRNFEQGHTSSTKNFDLASSGDSLSFDDDVAVYNNEVLVKIVEKVNNTCVIAITASYKDSVPISALEPVNDLSWYSTADPELFKDTKGYIAYQDSL